MMKSLPSIETCKICIIGLGYVGLPLAVEFSKRNPEVISNKKIQRSVVGFDVNHQRISQLKEGIDCTNECNANELMNSSSLSFTSDFDSLNDCDVYIITVPTPIDTSNKPDLTAIRNASITVGKALKKRHQLNKGTTPIVIYESTVYPGATEEYCIPILEEHSSLIINQDFCCGYSPERINPGDKKHRLTNIVKVTSGSCPKSAVWVDELYSSIIKAGTYMSPSLKVAEAAKVIENTQRDLNIALINELAVIFRHLGIDTLDVLKAAGTKWNFLDFCPGLVGGHCIGVDPYYLTYKADQVGYHPEVVLAGRRINNNMNKWIVEQLILEMVGKDLNINNAEVLVLGFTFKENCPDIRNTKIQGIVENLLKYKTNVTVVDPWVDPDFAKQHLGHEIKSNIPDKKYDAIILAVAHDQFAKITVTNWQKYIKSNSVIYDLKGIVPRELNPLRL